MIKGYKIGMNIQPARYFNFFCFDYEILYIVTTDKTIMILTELLNNNN